MTAYLGTGSSARPWVLLAVLALLRCTSAQFCSFWNNGCIDPLAQTAVTFEFEPLFVDPITLFYAFDSSKSGRGDGPMTKTAFWLGYKDRGINSYAVDTNRTSEIALAIGNVTGTPSGPNNGCDGIWGGPCSTDIKMALQSDIFKLATASPHEYYDQPLATVLNQYMIKKPDLPSCGASVFEVASIPVQDFAYESAPSQEVTVMKAGSGYHPWQVWYLDHMTDAQQASQVAVGIASRAPTQDGRPPLTPGEIQIELVCLQAPEAPQTGSGKDND